jgi:hypothetical protein
VISQVCQFAYFTRYLIFLLQNKHLKPKLTPKTPENENF